MRGRTNISGGITLNANTDEFVVSTGSTITGGDFVEYDYNEETVDMNTTFNDEAFLISDNIYIGIIGRYATLFAYNHGVIEVQSQDNTLINQIEKLDNSHYVGFLSNSYGTNNLILLTVTSTTLTKSYSTTLTNISAKLVGISSTVFCLVTSSKIDSFLCNNSYTSFSTGSSMNLGSATFAGSTSEYICVDEHIDTYYYLNKYGVNGITGVITLISRIARSSSVNGESTTKAIDNRYLLLSVNSGLYLVDTQSDQIRFVYNFGNNATETICSRPNTYNELIIERYLGTGNTATYYLVRVNTSLMSVSVENTLSDVKNIRCIYTFNDINNAIMIDNVGYRGINIDGDVLKIGTPANTVKQWQGSGNPMGVAKGTGTAGETIEVYIPQVSS